MIGASIFAVSIEAHPPPPNLVAFYGKHGIHMRRIYPSCNPEPQFGVIGPMTLQHAENENVWKLMISTSKNNK